MRVLITGATGKVGQHFIGRLLAASRWESVQLRALCHNRSLDPSSRMDVVHGSISDRHTVKRALEGVTHVVHLSTVKEAPDLAMDVSVKGMFLLLEEFRASADAVQFMHLSGDCSVGHIFQAYDGPVTESSPRRAYQGVYALSKVLEEAMLEQYGIQYGLNGCCLRAPWIMEKDDFRYALSFGEDQFGGPPWKAFMPAEQIAQHHAGNGVPLLRDATGAPLKRNFVHIDDLVSAMLVALDNPVAHRQLFNIAMTDPVDYGEVAEHLERTRGMVPVEIATDFHSNHLDNAKARQMLGWRPQYDLQRLIEEAFSYQRAAEDPRRIWYPG